MYLLELILAGLMLIGCICAAAADTLGPFPDMIVVPEGAFEMGGDRDDWAAPDERGNRIIDYLLSPSRRPR